MKKKKILIDTTILVYAFGRELDNEKIKKAKILLEEMFRQEKFRVCLSAQNIAEFARVMIEKCRVNPKEVKEIILILEELTEIKDVSIETVKKALEIQNKTGIHYWDAQIVSMMKLNKIDTIYTENVRDFNKVTSFKVINPLL